MFMHVFMLIYGWHKGNIFQAHPSMDMHAHTHTHTHWAADRGTGETGRLTRVIKDVQSLVRDACEDTQRRVKMACHALV